MEYDLDCEQDGFWDKHKTQPFPYVAEDIEKELSAWK